MSDEEELELVGEFSLILSTDTRELSDDPKKQNEELMKNNGFHIYRETSGGVRRTNNNPLKLNWRKFSSTTELDTYNL